MKQQKISDAINFIDDDLIERTEAVRNRKKTVKTSRLKWGVAAACFVLVMFVGVQQISDVTTLPDGDKNNDVPEMIDNNLPELPMLTITEDTSAGMGFEGYMVYNISELVNGNPWSEAAELSTLPVYGNQLTYDEHFQVFGVDFNAMEEFMRDVAARLGMDTSNLEISVNTPSKEEQAAVLEKTDGDIPEGYFAPTQIVAEGEGVKIEVDAAMTAEITFEPAIALPDEYNFTYHSSYEDMAAVAAYLKETYKNLLGMDNPKINIDGGDYDIYYQQGYDIEFYDECGDLINQILNYNFYPVAFYCNDYGELRMVRIYNPDLSDKIGDYPIISAKEAVNLLLNGNYITSVPYEFPGLDYIAKVELIYRTGEMEQCYMPYYRFYVELPERERVEGLKTYGAYYVPAVEEAYISNMPVWDGSFN